MNNNDTPQMPKDYGEDIVECVYWCLATVAILIASSLANIFF